MSKASISHPSRRMQRVVKELQHACAALLSHELSSLGLDIPVASVTVTHVRVSPDLKSAMVMVTPLGGDAMGAEELAAALNNHGGILRRELTRYIELKYVPRLTFSADTSFEAALELDRLFHSDRVRADIEKDDERLD